MTRRKVSDSEKLTCKITIRVSTQFFAKLQAWLEKSNCRTITELTRAILLKEKINWYHKNAELESVALELATVRCELNSIGRNINQITRHFHNAGSSGQKLLLAMKVAGEYKRVEGKVDQLLKITADISKKWLQK